MKILVFMSDNRSLENDINKSNYNSLTASINYEYCKKNNYDFIYYVPYFNDINDNILYNCLDPKNNILRHSAWSKLLSTKLALSLDYDYIVYIDSDCIFKDNNRRIEDFINKYSEYDTIFLNNRPFNNNNEPCSGFYICKKGVKTEEFIDDWYNVDMKEKNKNHAWEQDGLYSIYKNYNIITIDNENFFNENNNQFLRHVCHCENKNRIPYFKKFIEDKRIDFSLNILAIKCIYFNTNYEEDPLINKKYSWKNSCILFLKNGEMSAFGKGKYKYINKHIIKADFGEKEHIITFNSDFSNFESIRKGDNEIQVGYKI
jgi:hypothetical protein